ncbi:putative glutathione S-transferase [Xylogone sp. PMI_703]|nr:putative glutathione S-transferase [Xylogone sp. PMI_703]
MAQSVSQKTIPTLYNMSSSQAMVVLWALEEVAAAHGIKYNLKNLPRRDKSTAKELKAIFPMGKSPIVTLEPVDGEPDQVYQILPNVLVESRLILQFISDNYSTGEWIPESEQERRRDIFFQELAKCSLVVKVDFALLFEVIASVLPFGLRHFISLLIKPIVKHFVDDQRDIYQIMEDALSEELPWFSGRKIGLADFNMSFAMDMASQRGYFQPKEYPKVAKWYTSMIERPAYKRALEKGGVYDLAAFA